MQDKQIEVVLVIVTIDAIIHHDQSSLDKKGVFVLCLPIAVIKESQCKNLTRSGMV